MTCPASFGIPSTHLKQRPVGRPPRPESSTVLSSLLEDLRSAKGQVQTRCPLHPVCFPPSWGMRQKASILAQLEWLCKTLLRKYSKTNNIRSKSEWLLSDPCSLGPKFVSQSTSSLGLGMRRNDESDGCFRKSSKCLWQHGDGVVQLIFADHAGFHVVDPYQKSSILFLQRCCKLRGPRTWGWTLCQVKSTFRVLIHWTLCQT